MEKNWRVWSVRGAVTLTAAEKEQMLARVGELLSELCNKNGIDTSNIVNMQFTQTEDIQFFNAARAARLGSMGSIASASPLFCSVEPNTPRSLKLTIRVMLSYYQSYDHRPEAVYLYEARTLRSDLFNAQ